MRSIKKAAGEPLHTIKKAAGEPLHTRKGRLETAALF